MVCDGYVKYYFIIIESMMKYEEAEYDRYKIQNGWLEAICFNVAHYLRILAR